MATRKPVSGSYENFSYAYLHEAASFALDLGTEDVRGAAYHRLTSMLMSAFCLEAYLNHAGAELFRFWDNDTKQGTNSLSKLKLICSALSIPRTEADAAFSAAKAVVGFRNSVVHAQSERGEFQGTHKEGMPAKLPELNWMARCTVGNAKRFLEDVERIIEMIHKAAGFLGPAWGVMGDGSFSY